MTTLILASLLLGQSGLKVEDMKVGKGPAAKAGDVLTMSYRGTLTNGKVFDETGKKPPFAFKLGEGQVIKGWDQGLVGIKAGGKRKLTIPASLAYGEKGVGEIPANSTLVFVVEALRIDDPKATPKVEIKDVKVGTGPAAKTGNSVTMHYIGTFINGVEFDKSIGREPFTITLGQGSVIPGFEQGIMGMKKGGKRKVTIPYQLAYGERGRPPVIPQMATLVFELEMLSLK
ncbi:MAG: FKBP-type peptidyl-prolyl cis-trans isomerase [Methanoregulaceae archaeon]|nr:FKBP-type peptidyl-prolyl cis-trans isomerase [Methanoregulaceae archaeon]